MTYLSHLAKNVWTWRSKEKVLLNRMVRYLKFSTISTLRLLMITFFDSFLFFSEVKDHFFCLWLIEREIIFIAPLNWFSYSVKIVLIVIIADISNDQSVIRIFNHLYVGITALQVVGVNRKKKWWENATLGTADVGRDRCWFFFFLITTLCSLLVRKLKIHLLI